MKLALYTGIFALSLFVGNASHANLVIPGGPNSCLMTLAEKNVTDASKPTSRWIQYSTQVSGVIIGGANDIIITATHGGAELIAPGVSKWFVFANETANVVSTATGKEWIYSGIRKRLIDGVAIGAIIGQSMRAGNEHGIYEGIATFALDMGLTMWFPNKYFRPLMKAIPQKFPKPIREALEHPVGQGFVGISMIVVLEIILEHSQELARFLPGMFGAQIATPTLRAYPVAEFFDEVCTMQKQWS